MAKACLAKSFLLEDQLPTFYPEQPVQSRVLTTPEIKIQQAGLRMYTSYERLTTANRLRAESSGIWQRWQCGSAAAVRDKGQMVLRRHRTSESLSWQ
jgi:hypothetical protein